MNHSPVGQIRTPRGEQGPAGRIRATRTDQGPAGRIRAIAGRIRALQDESGPRRTDQGTVGLTRTLQDESGIPGMNQGSAGRIPAGATETPGSLNSPPPDEPHKNASGISGRLSPSDHLTARALLPFRDLL